jgi:hypothetical protein
MHFAISGIPGRTRLIKVPGGVVKRLYYWLDKAIKYSWDKDNVINFIPEILLDRLLSTLRFDCLFLLELTLKWLNKIFFKGLLRPPPFILRTSSQQIKVLLGFYVL